MGNCLVTRLKGVVDNDNLPKLGVLRCVMKVYDGGVIQANQNIRPASGKTILITLLDDGVTIASAANGATKIDDKNGTLSSSWNSQLVLSGAVANDLINVEFSMKYDTTELHISNKSTFDLSELKYCTLLTDLSCSALSNTADNHITGDIANLADFTAVTNLRIGWNPGIYGDIESLGKLTSMTTLGIASDRTIEGGTNDIRGNFEDFVIAQRANGRTSCESLTIKQADWVFVSFGNVDRPRFYDNGASVDAILKWDATHITYVCASKERVYLIGYTQTEINTMIAAGGVYEGYTAIKCD